MAIERIGRNRDVEVSQDVIGFVLIFKRDIGKNREGEPVCLTSGDIRYFRTRRAAAIAAAKINSGRKPLIGGHIAF